MAACRACGRPLEPNRAPRTELCLRRECVIERERARMRKVHQTRRKAVA